MKLLILDDEKNMRHMLESMLKKHGYEIVCVSDGIEGLEKVANDTFDFILCDIRMPGMDGLEFLDKAQTFIHDNSTVIMMSAYGSIDLALEAMKKGAYDFISKPFKSDEVLLALKKAEEREKLKKENRYLKEKLRKVQFEGGFAGMIGESKVMKAFFVLARKVSEYNATLLITGESGTGKEMVAKGVHLNSPRKDEKFIAVNCGAIPENLVESELFGYSKGAFTGADHDKKGLIATAEGGTLFLDEIGELPMSMQVKLLRFLQESEVRPVGSSKVLSVDARIITATSRDLEAEVARDNFRQDLFFRLNILRLHVPPLRERKDDIPALCNHLVSKFCVKMECEQCSFQPEALTKLLHYDFPGNVRELENIIQRSLIVAEKGVIRTADLPLNSGDTPSVSGKLFDETFSLKIARKILDKTMINKVMDETNGNKSQAARLLEISYPSLLNKIKEYGLLFH